MTFVLFINVHSFSSLNEMTTIPSSICVLIIFSVIAIKLIGGDFYDYAKNLFDEKFNTATNVNQVLNANQTQKIINTHSTVYGVGGTKEEIKYLFKDIEYLTSNINSKKIEINNIYKQLNEEKAKIFEITKGCKIGKEFVKDITNLITTE